MSDTSIEELADQVIRLSHDALDILVQGGLTADIERVLDILDSIIVTTHDIKEQQDEGFEHYFGQRVEEGSTEDGLEASEEDPGYHVL